LAAGTVDAGCQSKSIKDKEHTITYREIIWVWKNKESRRRLSKEQDAVLPEHSAGLTELADAELDDAVGSGRAMNNGSGGDLRHAVPHLVDHPHQL
jgi:mersacidin/lichenicidin family type 2 lantibiotic